jgi:hypothetical protein
MVAAAATLWLTFSLFLIAPLVEMPALTGRIAIGLCATELVALLTWSFGSERCDEPTCAPIAQAAGIAARTDLPALTVVFFVVVLLQLRRSTPAPE